MWRRALLQVKNWGGLAWLDRSGLNKMLYFLCTFLPFFMVPTAVEHILKTSSSFHIIFWVSLTAFSITLEEHFLSHGSMGTNVIMKYLCMHPSTREEFQFCFSLLCDFFPDKDRTLVPNSFPGTKLSKCVLCLSRSLIIMTKQLCLCYYFRKTSPDFKWRQRRPIQNNYNGEFVYRLSLEET